MGTMLLPVDAYLALKKHCMGIVFANDCTGEFYRTLCDYFC